MKTTHLTKRLAVLLIAVALATVPGTASAASESYIIVSQDGTTVTFYHDSQKEERQGTILDLDGYEGLETDAAASVTKVVFDPSFADARPTSTYSWFFNLSKLASIEGMKYLNTSEVTSMQAMFSQCSSLKSIDLSHFDTSKVTSIRNMFNGCSSLTSIDVTKFNTSNVTTMYGTFSGCSGLTSLDVRNFDTSNVTTMEFMFNKCSKLASLDLSGFNTAKVESMRSMFNSCTNLASLDVSGFNTSNVTTMYYMFYKCSNLASLDVSKFNTSKVTTMEGMFNTCSALETIDVSAFNTSKVTSMRYMFNECRSLKTLDLSNFDTSKATNTVAMFDNDYSLTHLAISGTMGNLNATACNGVGTEENPCRITAPEGFDFGVPSHGIFNWKGGYFIHKNGIKTYIEISEDGTVITFYYDHLANARTGRIIYLGDDVLDEYFYDDDGYDDDDSWPYDEEQDYDDERWGWYIWKKMVDGKMVKKVVFDASFANARPITCYEWFAGFSALENIEGIENLNTSKVTNMWGMFMDCSSIKSLDLSHFDTSNVLSYFGDIVPDLWGIASSGIHYMFSGCSSLESINLSSFNTSKIMIMEGMFMGCSSLKSLDVSNFDTSCTLWMDYMFTGCSSLTYLDLSHFDTSKVEGMSHMFEDCRSLTSLDLSNFDTSAVDYLFPRAHEVGGVLPETDGMDDMFKGCSSLKNLDVSHFNISSVASFNGMFEGCSSLTNINLFRSSTSSANSDRYSYYHMFSGCSSLTSLDLSGFNIIHENYDINDDDIEDEIESNTDGLLEGCSSLKKLTFDRITGQMKNLADNACNGVGTKSAPCLITAPEGFDFDVETTGSFQWKSGWFTLANSNSDYPLGDVNHDGDVNVADVMMTVSEILGKRVDGFHRENADMNGDGALNITDVMGIVDIILHHLPNNAPALATADGLSTVPATSGVELRLDNAYRYTAMEMTVELPQGATLTRASLCNPGNHHVKTHALDNGLYRVVVYSLSGGSLPEGDALLHLDIAGGGDVKVSDIVLTNTFFEALSSQEATGITDITSVSNDEPIYNIQGMKVISPNKGVYIQNRQKVVVK